MTLHAKVLGIALTLALTAAGQVANAIPQTQPGKPSSAENALAETKDADSLSGKVVETMEAGGYTYVCLEKNGAKTWVAVPLTKVKVGEEMAFQPGQEMANFKSRTLNRTFEKIYFSGGLVAKQAAAKDEAVKGAHGGKSIDEMKGKTADAAPKAAATESIKVEKAAGPNGYTVAELYGKKESLDKKKVVVRGKVVKVSTGIMGKTWVHLRDGSGDAAADTNNLVVTTQDVPAVGDVVTASGTLYKDKDFGAGYKYNLIIEEASLKP